MKAGIALVVAGGIAALLTGCSDSATPAQQSATTSAPAASAPAAGQSPPAPAPDGLINEDTGETTGAHQVPTWDATSRKAATAAATTAMTAFAQPGLGYDEWWAVLEPLLSAQAQADYAFVDPANVPAKAVTGAARLVDESSAYIAHVSVPTDAGVYTVVLSRIDAGAPWLAERITPPGEAN